MQRNNKIQTERQADAPRYVVAWNDRSRMPGRIAVIVALLVFASLYGLGIMYYGPIIGIGLGWIPSAAIAWMTANLIVILARPTSRRFAGPH